MYVRHSRLVNGVSGPNGRMRVTLDATEKEISVVCPATSCRNCPLDKSRLSAFECTITQTLLSLAGAEGLVFTVQGTSGWRKAA